MRNLKIHSLPSGSVDRDEILLHASFQILVDFLEREFPAEYVNWELDAQHKIAWREIKYLYKWWLKKRPNRKYPLDDKRIKVPPLDLINAVDEGDTISVPEDKSEYTAYFRARAKQEFMEKEYRAEDQLNLHRLIEIRLFLWS